MAELIEIQLPRPRLGIEDVERRVDYLFHVSGNKFGFGADVGAALEGPCFCAGPVRCRLGILLRNFTKAASEVPS